MRRPGDSSRPLRRERSSTLAVGWSSTRGTWPSERGRWLERTVQISRVRSRLWVANNAQLVAWGNAAFEQRDMARQYARNSTAIVHTLPWSCMRTFPLTLRLASLKFAISSRGSSTRVPAEWNNMPASTARCLRRPCAKRRIAS